MPTWESNSTAKLFGFCFRFPSSTTPTKSTKAKRSSSKKQETKFASKLDSLVSTWPWFSSVCARFLIQTIKTTNCAKFSMKTGAVYHWRLKTNSSSNSRLSRRSTTSTSTTSGLRRIALTPKLCRFDLGTLSLTPRIKSTTAVLSTWTNFPPWTLRRRRSLTMNLHLLLFTRKRPNSSSMSKILSGKRVFSKNSLGYP